MARPRTTATARATSPGPAPDETQLGPPDRAGRPRDPDDPVGLDPPVAAATPDPVVSARPDPVVSARPDPSASDTTAPPGAVTFEELYRDEYDEMVRVAYLLVGTLESAEELVQDAFIRVHLRWDRIDAPGAYLRTCVVNGCRDRIRRRVRLRARMPRLTADAADRNPSIDGGDAGPAAELHDVLLRLPMRQRTAIVGRFFCGWDDATIAELLGVRPTTIRSLVHRGLASLRTEIPR